MGLAMALDMELDMVLDIALELDMLLGLDPAQVTLAPLTWTRLMAIAPFRFLVQQHSRALGRLRRQMQLPQTQRKALMVAHQPVLLLSTLPLALEPVPLLLAVALERNKQLFPARREYVFLLYHLGLSCCPTHFFSEIMPFFNNSRSTLPRR
jgi:hypothetical protein